jgi:outer membrane protein OmpA-like peptidoglycan-associated protein
MRYLLLIFSILLASSAQAVRHFHASIEQAQWRVESSRIRCELSQPIPYYGKGRFVVSAGGELSFMTSTFAPMARDGTVSVMSVPPFWKVAQTRQLGQSVLSRGYMPVHITGELAARILHELDAGMQPAFKYKDSYDDNIDILVSLSAVRLRNKLRDFRHCVQQLIPYGVDKLKPVTVSFKVNKYRLSASIKRDLEALALFASADKKIHILVEGYTDNRGSRRYNRALSKRRNLAVVSYLTSMGVDIEQIQSQSYGEKRPLSSNKKFMGRAFNRRVEVSFTRVQ